MGHLHPGDRDDRDICECNAMPIPEPISPEVGDGCNGTPRPAKPEPCHFCGIGYVIHLPGNVCGTCNYTIPRFALATGGKRK